jgi:hypothetical protein
LIKGAANKTKGVITIQAMSQDLSQLATNIPWPRNGALAIPAATAQVKPDWMNPNTK